MSNAANARM